MQPREPLFYTIAPVLMGLTNVKGWIIFMETHNVYLFL